MSDYVRTVSGDLIEASLLGYGEGGAQMFSAAAFAGSARAQRLARLESYFRNRQHDHRRYSWDGELLPAFEPGHQPLLSTAAVPHFVPMAHRRPSAPYRLPRKVARSFTSLLFGEGRSPEIRVVGDPDTQDFDAALAEACDLFGALAHARDLGGASGTSGVSWRFWNGLPRLRVHPGSTIHCQSWADPELLIPEVVTSLVAVDKDVLNEKTGAIEVKRHWRRRDWTPLADVAFADQAQDARDKEWLVDVEATVVHGEGKAHFVWIQNSRDFDGSSPDGEGDYEGEVEACDALDALFSAVVHGGAKNVDPTLLLKMSEQQLARSDKVRKGSEWAIVVGEQGGAEYLELSGTSLDVGIRLVDRLRNAILETCEVVALDPDKAAAAGASSVALKAIYAPQLARAAHLRTVYGRAAVQILTDMNASIRARQPIDGEDGPVYALSQKVGSTEDRSSVEGEGGEAEPAEPEEEDLFVRLPPRVVEEQVLDPETGQPTGETVERVVERKLGKGGEVTLHWPDWFPRTADDEAKEIGTLSTAAGGRAVVSQKSAVERAALLWGLDAEEEWRAVAAQQQAEQEAQAGMFPGAGNPEPGPAEAPEQPPAPEVKPVEQPAG